LESIYLPVHRQSFLFVSTFLDWGSVPFIGVGLHVFEKKAAVKYWKMGQIKNGVSYITPKEGYRELLF